MQKEKERKEYELMLAKAEKEDEAKLKMKQKEESELEERLAARLHKEWSPKGITIMTYLPCMFKSAHSLNLHREGRYSSSYD